MNLTLIPIYFETFQCFLVKIQNDDASSHNMYYAATFVESRKIIKRKKENKKERVLVLQNVEYANNFRIVNTFCFFPSTEYGVSTSSLKENLKQPG